MYQEKQRFTQWWLWAILIGIAAIVTLGIYQQIIKGESFGNNPMSDTGLIIFAVSMYAFPILFGIMHLDTKIDSEHIKFNFVPFMKKSVAWSDVKTAEVLDYATVGGWGIKHSSKHGTVYSTGGDLGLAIVMKNGRKFVIGTQNEAELKLFIDKSNFTSG